MKFSVLAGYLEKLEETNSRLEMTRVLAQLLEKVGPEEGKVAAYLIQGMLGPKYANPDMGMAEKQVIKAIERISKKDVLTIFKREGDLGKTVEKIKSPPFAHSELRRGKQNLVVREVYEKLLEIAKVSGEGSQEKKINLLSDLVTELEPKSAKYAVKIVLGRMRGGFSDMTILDALSWMVAGDKSLRPEIERIYNVRADLGEVVKLVKENLSNEAIRKLRVSPAVGTPILVARGERAKSPKEIWERLGVSAAEHKLDGLRIQAHVKVNGKQEKPVKLFSRGMEDVTSMYPDVVEGLEKQVRESCILDGEMIAVGSDGKYLAFQETVQRKRKYNIEEMLSKVPLKYYTFDVLYAAGRSFLDEPNEKRWEELERILKVSNKDDTVRLIPRIIVHSEKEIETYFYEALSVGTEGIFVKKLSGTYQSGSRNFNWIKYKKSYDESGEADTIDAVVMGYDAGEGKRSGFGIGGFLIGVYDKKNDKFQTIAKIGTGLKDDEWRELYTKCKMYNLKSKPENYEVSKQMECDFWVKPVMVVEIKCDEITKSPMHTSGYALRFPRLVTFREVKIEEAATPDEIKKLFELQGKKAKGGGKDGG